MIFTLAEKLAVIKVIDAVIVVDNLVHDGETAFLNKLMLIIDFESNFLIHAKYLDYQESLVMLNEMSLAKKRKLEIILHNVSKADGFVHKKETALITSILSSIGLNNMPEDYQV